MTWTNSDGKLSISCPPRMGLGTNKDGQLQRGEQAPFAAYLYSNCEKNRELQVFKHLEDTRRRCPGNIRPGNGVHYRLAQLLTTSPGVGTGLQIRRKTTLATKPLDAFSADHQPATIAPAGDEQFLERPASRTHQIVVPLPKALKWIFALRVEDQHCQGGFVHVELMDQAIVGLSGEVPEPDFPLDVIATSVVW